MTWNRADDPREVMLRIAAFAKVLARLRGTISVWREGSGDDETYNFSTPVIEQPHRAMSLLYALARGHALVHGRERLNEDDLPLVARAALESTPNDRRAVMRILVANGGDATTPQVQEALRCSHHTAKAILETLDKLGVGSLENPGPPLPATLRLASGLDWLLEPDSGAQRQAISNERPLEANRRRAGEGIETKPSKDEGDDGHHPFPGDDLYPLFLAEAANKGYVTGDEFAGLHEHHKLVERAREARTA